MRNYNTLANMLHNRCPDLVLEENVLLSQYTSFKIGGACPLLAFPSNETELIACIEESLSCGIPCFPLGNGSNLLIADEGVDAFFVQMKDFSQILSHSGEYITAQSGILLSKLAQYALDQSLTGLEFAHGIPGTLGGALMMNAGAYGGEMKDVVVSVQSYSKKDRRMVERSLDELQFSYRHSIFSEEDEVIFSAKLRLTQGVKEEIKSKMKQLMNQRLEKQPLDLPSCGSTFKRPENHYAAALIDQCNLKGFSVGDAQVSTKHSGFIVNVGSARCSDVLSLVEQVQHKVLVETGVPLELEVKVLK